MKLSEFFMLAFVAFVMWPWVVGLADLTAWLVVGSQFSGIPWASERGFVALVWPVVWSLIFAGGHP